MSDSPKMPIHSRGVPPRIIFDCGALTQFNRGNVELVTGGIDRATPTGIVAKADGKERECEVVIFATGWGAFTMGRGFPTYGRGGKELWERWNEIGVPRA